MRHVAVVLGLVVGPGLVGGLGCGDDATPGTDGSLAGSDGSGRGDGAASDTTTGDGPTATPDGSTTASDGSTRPPGDGAAAGCGLHLSGMDCADGACTFSEECTSGRCDCESGSWTCTSTRTCSGMCPQASETSCGDSCDGEVSGCLCRCGGGPNFSSCSCTGGSWSCVSCNG